MDLLKYSTRKSLYHTLHGRTYKQLCAFRINTDVIFQPLHHQNIL